MGAVKKRDSVSWHRMNKEAEYVILGWGRALNNEVVKTTPIKYILVKFSSAFCEIRES